MKFEGRLTQFFPPDLLLFVASLNKEGVLTLTDTLTVLTVTLKEGRIIDAQSENADRKILKSLLAANILSQKNFTTIELAREQTRMPVRQILDSLNLLGNKAVKTLYLNGAKEVFFEFFRLKTGFFKFTELNTDLSGDVISLNPQAIAVEISQWADEASELESEFADSGRLITPVAGTVNVTKKEAMVLKETGNGIPLKELITNLPIPSFPAMRLIRQMLDKKRLKLHDLPSSDMAPPPPVSDSLIFTEFRNAARKIIQATSTTERMKSLLRFCKPFFDNFFILSLSRHEILHQIHYFKDHNRALRKKLRKNIAIDLTTEPVFLNSVECGVSFFGNYFPTRIVDGDPLTGGKETCAVIPYQKTKNAVNILYVISPEHDSGESPLRYLEILSWLINPASGTTALATEEDLTSTDRQPEVEAPKEPSDTLKSLADTISELPPMPHIASQALTLLSAPDFNRQKLVDLIAQDPSIMASLLKISNSALYRAAQKITTVNEAVKRLGPKVIKSSIIAAATRSLFPGGDSDFHRLSHPLWVHSKECAVIARRIAMESGAWDPEEAFMAGLLHDLGKLAMLMKHHEIYRQIQTRDAPWGPEGLDHERKQFGYTHNEVGRQLMIQWNMPDTLIQCVRHHHNAGSAQQEENVLGCLVEVADHFTHELSQSGGTGLLDTPDAILESLNGLGLETDKLPVLLDKLGQDLENVHVFG